MGAPLTGDLRLQRLHVVFLIRSFGFPEGGAASNRVRLFGKALREQNVDVRVICTRASELPGKVLSRSPRGVCDGIPYLYTSGATVRSPSFVVRRLREVIGYSRALVELARLQRSYGLDCVYFPDHPGTLMPAVWLLRRWLRALHVPIVAEFNEPPGQLSWLPDSLSHHFSHLAAVKGAVAISDWLLGWVTAEATRIGRTTEVIKVPIVVDIDEQVVRPYPADSMMFVYSAAITENARAATFIFKAMERVWLRYPGCRLTITGVEPSRLIELTETRLSRVAMSEGRIVIAGYADRASLLRFYRNASALLIPLFDDPRSRARFPSKIGEYLAAARPVVATSVGEVARFLRDGETAYVAPPGDVEAFAAKLLEVLDDPARAAQIGVAGRRLAEEQFDYTLQGPRLRTFIESIARRPIP